MPWTRRRPPRWPLPSRDLDADETRARHRACGAPAARSAPAPTCARSRRAGIRRELQAPDRCGRTTRSGRWARPGMELGKPVIAAVAGHAVAGGLELALWCDLRVVEEDAVFGVFCRRWGVPLIDGGTVRLPRLIGESRALDLILTGRAGARRRSARRSGSPTASCPSGQSRAAAEALAARARRPAPALPALGSALRARHNGAGRRRTRSRRNSTAGLAVLASGESAAGAARFVGGAGRGGN